MTSNKFCCAMDIREVHEPVQSKLFSPLQQSGLDVTQLGLFSSTCQFTWLSYFSYLAGVLSPPAHWLALLLSVSASVSQPASIWEELSWESPSWFAVGTKICLIDIVKKDIEYAYMWVHHFSWPSTKKGPTPTGRQTHSWHVAPSSMTPGALEKGSDWGGRGAKGERGPMFEL